ncbi:hypothetical protein QJS66_03025 [Kocuria rhizophila]|nr:hypothetical protein QJS66_03025 [Kocuria rhizophila]
MAFTGLGLLIAGTLRRGHPGGAERGVGGARRGRRCDLPASALPGWLAGWCPGCPPRPPVRCCGSASCTAGVSAAPLLVLTAWAVAAAAAARAVVQVGLTPERAVASRISRRRDRSLKMRPSAPGVPAMSDTAPRTAVDSFWSPSAVTPWVRFLAVASPGGRRAL